MKKKVITMFLLVIFIVISGRDVMAAQKNASSTKQAYDISKSTVSFEKEQTYSGKAIKPEVRVTLNGKTLKKGTEYTIKYYNNTKAGNAIIKIVGKGKYKGYKNVKFTILPKIKLSKTDITIKEGESKRLSSVIKAGKSIGQKVKWSSSNTQIATVDGAGNIKAVKAGKAVIKAVSADNKKVYAKCTVKVESCEIDNVDVVAAPVSVSVLEKNMNKDITSYEELQKVIEEIKSIKSEDPYITYSEYEEWYYSYVLENLEKYEESYFEDHVVSLRTYHNIQTMLEASKIEKIQKSSGKYQLRISLKNTEPLVDATPETKAGFLIIISAESNLFDDINQIKFVHDFS